MNIKKLTSLGMALSISVLVSSVYAEEDVSNIQIQVKDQERVQAQLKTQTQTQAQIQVKAEIKSQEQLRLETNLRAYDSESNQKQIGEQKMEMRKSQVRQGVTTSGSMARQRMSSHSAGNARR